MATLKDIANACDVSIATVSRVLNNDLSFKIKRETRENIIKTAADMNYKKVSALDINSLTVALVQWISQEHEQADPYYYDIRKSVAYQCYFHDIYLTQYYIENIDTMAQNKNIDAIICIGKFSPSEINYFNNITPNMIFIDSNPNETLYTSVLYDLEYGMERTIQFLIEMGHQKIAYIGGQEYIGNEKLLYQDARERTFIELFQAGKFYSSEQYMYIRDFDFETGFDGINEFMRQEKSLPTAVVCANDLIAQGAMKAMKEANIENMSITSFNNLKESENLTPSLTTVDLDTQYIAVLAISQLINAHIMNQYGAVKLFIKPKLIIRESVKQI